jgi:hypothetical protein
MTHELSTTEFFKWQGAYRAFTIRKTDVPQIQAYIENQKQHHAERRLETEWEPGDENLGD